MKESIVLNKSKAFAIRIVRLYQWLTTEKKEFVMSKQCLRSGTSIGANVMEGKYGQSVPDFISKLHTALKEANETRYWLELLHETDYITQTMYESLHDDCLELVKLLVSIINTTKANNNL